MNTTDLNQRIEHTCLKPDIDEHSIRMLCEEACKYKFHAVVVNPVWVKSATEELKDSSVAVVSVAGFPLGANRGDVKIFEALKAIEDGATEIDLAANISQLLSGKYQDAALEIETLRKSMPAHHILKVIIEANRLSPQQQTDAVQAVIDGGADFVKTGTGFFGPVTIEQIRRIAAVAGSLSIKAAGGIRTVDQCRVLIAEGADRLGTSSGVQIMLSLVNDKKERGQL